MSTLNQREVLFPVRGGIFGVGRLATRLKALTTSRKIGEWHIGRWLNWKHTAIRITFATPADAAIAISMARSSHLAAPDHRDCPASQENESEEKFFPVSR